MDEAGKPERRKLQFSIRKLMLWIGIVAFLLGTLAMLEVGSIGLSLAFGFISVVGIVGCVRATFGQEWACRLWVLLVLTCHMLSWLGWITSGGLDDVLVASLASMAFLLLGFYFGVVTYRFLAALFRSVDWIDNFLQTKTTEKPS
jgi:hypothetical protein